MLPRFRLFEAIKQGSIDGVIDALKNGASIADRDLKGKSCLECAGNAGHLNVARLLIQKGLPVDELLNSKDRTLLIAAIRKGNMGFAELLLDYGASPNESNGKGVMPLMIAAQDGYAYLADSLLRRGAAIDAKDLQGNTATHYAAENGMVEVLRILLRRSSDVEIKNGRGSTPIDVAVLKGHDRIAQMLQPYCSHVRVAKAAASDESPLQRRHTSNLLAERKTIESERARRL